MSCNWPTVTIEDIAANIPNALATGPFGSAISSKFFTDHGVPVIRGSNLSADTSVRLKDEGIIFVSDEKAKEFTRSIARVGDLVFTCWGTINQVGYIDGTSKWNEYIISNKQMKLTVDTRKVDPRYLYYVFSSPLKQQEILSNAIGAAVPGFNLGQLRKHTFKLPPLTVQSAVADTLELLDTKFSNNIQTNQTLEQMAQAIFKSWFVDFDPVRQNMKNKELAKINGVQLKGAAHGSANVAGSTMPEATMDAPFLPKDVASIFPDKLVESELGLIPEGWKLTNIGKVSECFDKKRIPLSKRQREQKQGSIPYHGATSVMDYVDEAIFDDIYLLIGEDGSVMKDDGTPFIQYIWGPAWVNNHAHVLKGIASVSTEQLMLFFQQTNINAYVTGAVQLKINQGNMNRIPFVKATEDINHKFYEIIAPLYAKARAIKEENEQLAKLRNTLLPKLLSGEIDLEQTEEIAEAEAI